MFTYDKESLFRPDILNILSSESPKQTAKQVQESELLRLASFLLKLKKLEQKGNTPEDKDEYEFGRHVLRHAIFLRIITLTQLGAKNQAYALIEACGE